MEILMSNRRKQVNFSFRCQPREGTKNGILLTYLNEDAADMTRAERILHPLVAFWLPFAYQHCTDVSSDELQRVARSSINLLKLQIEYIEECFGLNGGHLPAAMGKPRTRLQREPQSGAPALGKSPNGSIPFDEGELYDGEDDDFSTEDQILRGLT
jgi:hypothetical protein